MKARELEKIIKNDGWVLDYSKASHYHYKHPIKKREGFYTFSWCKRFKAKDH